MTIEATALLILLRFHFHDLKEQLKTNTHTNFCSEWVLDFFVSRALLNFLVCVTWHWSERIPFRVQTCERFLASNGCHESVILSTCDKNVQTRNCLVLFKFNGRFNIAVTTVYWLVQELVCTFFVVKHGLSVINVPILKWRTNFGVQRPLFFKRPWLTQGGQWRTTATPFGRSIYRWKESGSSWWQIPIAFVKQPLVKQESTICRDKCLVFPQVVHL